jgi:hypothetical protein
MRSQTLGVTGNGRDRFNFFYPDAGPGNIESNLSAGCFECRKVLPLESKAQTRAVLDFD